MTAPRNTPGVTASDFAEWSRKWESARRSVGRGPLAAALIAQLSGLALSELVLRHALPGLWYRIALTILMFAPILAAGVVYHRRMDRVMMSLGRLCSACRTIVHDSRAVMKNGGHCTRCGGRLYAAEVPAFKP